MAKKVKKVSVPLTYQQEQAQLKKEEAKRDRQDEAEARKADRQDFAEEAYGKHLGKLWLIWIAWFVFLWSVGATVGALTQSWLWALVALVAAFAASWGLGYRKALAAVPLVVVVVGSLATSLLLTLSLAHLGYAHPLASPYTETISTGFFSSKDVTEYHYLFLGRQLDFGLIWGAATSLVGVAVAFFLKPPYGKRKGDRSIYAFSGIYQGYSSRQSPEPKQARYLSVAHLIWTALGIGIIGFVFWLVAAFIAPASDWGFGFDLGANMAWLGLGLGCALGIGVGGSIPIWWTAVRQWIQERG